jgi:large subunit ribosomal protein L4e
MFAPTKLWRRWFVKSNQKQKRYATASALAATALPSLLLARGHRVEEIEEVPLVVANEAESLTKTKEAVALLKAVKAYPDVVKVANSRKIRAGVGKIRNRRHTQRRGPLVVYNEDKGIVKAFRNIPGVELVSVHRLNLLQLAPGGSIGRLCIWTEAAFSQLDKVFSEEGKKGFTLPIAKISNTDVTRLINSDEIQSIVRPVAGGSRTKRPHTQKKNPLKNRALMARLNPYAAAAVRAENRNTAQRKAGKLGKADKKQPRTPASAEFLAQLHAP